MASRDTSGASAPEANRASRGKASIIRATTQQQQSTKGPAQLTRSKTTEMAHASATSRACGYQAASKAVVTKPELAAPKESTQNDDNYVYIRVGRENMAPVDNGLTETVQDQVFQNAGPQYAAPVLFTVLVQPPEPRHSSGVEIPAHDIPRVSRSCSLADVVTRSWTRY